MGFKSYQDVIDSIGKPAYASADGVVHRLWVLDAESSGFSAFARCGLRISSFNGGDDGVVTCLSCLVGTTALPFAHWA